MPDTQIIQWDADGYPTEASLERLREVLRSEDLPTALRAFYGALRENKYPDACGLDRVEIRGEITDVWGYHTMGWSGNESIVGVLEDSWLFEWLLQRHDTGGHWYFKRPEDVPGVELEAE